MQKLELIILLILTCTTNYGQGFKKVKSKSKHSDKISSIVCNDDYFATSSYDGSFIVWDYKGKTLYKHKLSNGKINSMSFISDSNSLLVGITEKNENKNSRFVIKSFDINGNQEYELIDSRLTQDYIDGFYNENTVSEQNAITAIRNSFPSLNVEKELPVPKVEDGLSHIELVQYLAVSPKNKFIASIDKFNILNIWSGEGPLIRSVQINNKKKDTQIYFLSDSELFVTPNIVLDINTLDIELVDGFETYSSIIFDNMIYFFFDYNDKSRREKLFNRERGSSKEMDPKKFYTLAAARSKTKLSLLGTDGLIRVIDNEGILLSTFGKEKPEITTFRGERFKLFSKICKIGFSPNEKYIVSGDENGKVTIWESQFN